MAARISKRAVAGCAGVVLSSAMECDAPGQLTVAAFVGRRPEANPALSMGTTPPPVSLRINGRQAGRFFDRWKARVRGACPDRLSIPIRVSYWLALILMPAVLIGWATMLAKKTAPTGVSISFVGYTNSIMGSRFALFSLVNDDRLAIRWRGVASEVEGLGGMRAPVFDPTLPWITTATLKPGGSIRLAVGEPLESGRWRVQLRFSRCTVSERLSDFSTRHKLPAALVAFLPEVPRVYSTNSEWLKATSLWK